ncbi:alpha-mannosidase I MNS5 isoform X2 [Aristolochia californica]|uniref:alpha-mannosidase I MNS5 isoform X2 n=1 Tax=Aristolochia californica TaxID=171875 RepID=UPI0035E0FDFF
MSPSKSLSRFPAWVLLSLLFATVFTSAVSEVSSREAANKRYLSRKVRKMFYHAYNNYMKYAFPHDELKPLTKTYTDSLSELGNLKLEHLPQNYNGSALTLIESLSSLVVMGDHKEFEKAVLWLSDNLTFDVDARISLFECNIRVLGGLVSAHVLASDSANRLLQGVYNNQLLRLAEDLGRRFLSAFDTPTGLPYAWINLKYGVMENETTETSTSGCGSLILEMGALSRLTGVDSFYEYLMKAYVLFGREEFWDMFHTAYVAVQKYFRHGPWYHEADMRTGKATYWQLTSLQAFWPGLQVLVGDVAAANASHREFFNVWEKFGVLPERYLLDREMLHPTEKYYPLRPELAESTLYLYQATRDPWYFKVGKAIVDSLNLYTKVEGGYASIKDVTTMEMEDHQHSFFLAETCKYLFLLFNDSFLASENYIFTTEGHPLPVKSSWHDRLPENYFLNSWTSTKHEKDRKYMSAMSMQVCPTTVTLGGYGRRQVESACHVHDIREDYRCKTDEDCGIDSITCRKRSCSIAGYCGLWLSLR